MLTTHERGLRQEFIVQYDRPPGEAKWKATVKPGELLKDTSTTGMLTYNPGFFAEDAIDKPDRAKVVLLVPAPAGFDKAAFIHPTHWMQLAEQARQEADKVFRQNHPTSEVEYVVEF